MLILAKKYIVLDVSAITVAFFSKDKNAKWLTASCLVYYLCPRCVIKLNLEGIF